MQYAQQQSERRWQKGWKFSSRREAMAGSRQREWRQVWATRPPEKVPGSVQVKNARSRRKGANRYMAGCVGAVYARRRHWNMRESC